MRLEEEREKGTVLVAEDDPLLRMLYDRILNDSGYRILQAQDGVEALEILQGLIPEEMPDVFLLDLSMPRMNGPEFMRAVQEMGEPYSFIPIIPISAHEDLNKFYEVNGSTVLKHIQKPFNIDELSNAIKEGTTLGRERLNPFRHLM